MSRNNIWRPEGPAPFPSSASESNTRRQSLVIQELENSTVANESEIPSAFAIPETVITSWSRYDRQARASLRPPGAAKTAKKPMPELRAESNVKRWHLFVVLAVQALLSLRLVWSTSAYSDEGLYIWAGHVEWANWLHGSSTPQFAEYFSGAPAVYPPLAALADTLGGLTAARLLSILFMVAATSLLYCTAGRLFGRGSGLFAAAIFAGTGAAQFLGAFATYDAMTIFLLACSTWIGIKASDVSSVIGRVLLFAAAGLVLALADSAKYIALVFDPVVLGVIGCRAWQVGHNIRAGFAAVFVAGASLVGVTALALALAPAGYITGIEYTTLSRQHGSFPALQIIYVAAGWSGIVAVLAIIGMAAIASTWTSLPTRILGGILACATLIVPLACAESHLFVSMFKHVGYGEWFGALPAGYALYAFVGNVPANKFGKALRVAGGIVTIAAAIGFALAGNQYLNIGPNINAVLPAVSKAITGMNKPVIAADDANVAQYYLADISPSSLVYAIGPNPMWVRAYPAQELTYGTVTGDAALAIAIDRGYFNVVLISNFNIWKAQDSAVKADLKASGRYKLAMSVPYVEDKQQSDYEVWVRR
jgi:4-amino-4-deoxy-L-arabinose transferase-like glycosyltransferase